MSFAINIAANFTSRLTLLRTRTVRPLAARRGYGGAAGCRRADPADLAMLEYAAERYPHIERHGQCRLRRPMKRRLTFIIAILRCPRGAAARVVDSSGETTGAVTPVPLEVFAFGSLCIMSEAVAICRHI